MKKNNFIVPSGLHIIIGIFFILLSSCEKVPPVDQGNWQTITCKGEPSGRHENGFMEEDGFFYLFGGRGIKPVDRFDPATSSWTAMKHVPFELHHFQAVTVGDTVVVAGAMTGPYPTELPLENIWYYLPKKDEWIKGPEIPEKRRRGSCGAVFYQGKLYLVGGIEYGHTSGTCGWFDVFDFKSGLWKELPDAPHIRDHFHAIVVDNKLYCIGGRNTSVHEEDNFTAFFGATILEVDCYDFDTNSWTTLENKLPVGTAAGGIANYDNTLFYFGGESAQASAHSETQCLNLESGTWSFAAPLNRGRHGTAAIKYENQLYIASGSGNRGGGPELTSIEKYTLESEWQSLFNGHNLDNWQVRCLPEDENKNFWTVENGAITCNSMDDQNHNYIWLMSQNEYDNFELRLQFKAFRESPGNSGVQIRSRYDASPDAPDGGWLDGPQVDIHPPNPFRTGLIYDETREEKRWIYPNLENWEIDTSDVSHTRMFKYGEEGWNDLTIICNGTHIKTILNRDVITDWDGQGVLDNEAHKKHRVGQSGYLAFQLHAQDALKIQYKNIKIRKL